MGYFHRNYELLCDGAEILLAGASNGLELRLGEFMYDPRKNTYDFESTRKLQAHNRQFISELPHDPVEAQKFYRGLTTASLYFGFRHPLKSLKLNRIFKRAIKFSEED